VLAGRSVHELGLRAHDESAKTGSLLPLFSDVQLTTNDGPLTTFWFMESCHPQELTRIGGHEPSSTERGYGRSPSRNAFKD